jgi:hypothetical protein
VKGLGVPVGAPGAQVAVHDGRQLAGVLGPAVIGGVPRRGQQVRQLRRQPRDRRRPVGQVGTGRTGGRDRGPAVALVGIGGIHCHRRGVPVVVQQPANRRAPLGLVPDPGRGGVRPHEVVQHIPPGGGLLQQVGVEQLVEQLPGPSRRGRGQPGGGIGLDARAGVRAQHPVEAPMIGVELLVRQLERRGDAARSDRQLGQPLIVVAQPRHQVGDRPGGTGLQASGGDPDRQWQPPAQLDRFHQ